MLLRSLKRSPATTVIPVIVTTAHPELLGESDRPLAAAVLHKPFTIDQLLVTIESVLSAPQRRF